MTPRSQLLRIASLKRAGDKFVAKSQQRQWLTGTRDKCRDVECLTTAYRNRLQALQGMESDFTIGQDFSVQEINKPAPQVKPLDPEMVEHAGTMSQQETASMMAGEPVVCRSICPPVEMGQEQRAMERLKRLRPTQTFTEYEQQKESHSVFDVCCRVLRVSYC